MAKLLCVIIGGLRASLMACAHVHCLDRLASEGAVVRQLAPSSTLTLPTLVSLFTSTTPEEHGVLTNSGEARVSPQAVSLFSLLRYRQQSVCALYADDRLRAIFPPGSLQTGILLNSPANPTGTLVSPEAIEAACATGVPVISEEEFGKLIGN